MLRRLLIAEPDSRQSRGLAAAFPAEEFLPRVEAEPEDALDCALSWRPDCALIAAALPRMPGLDLCMRLRRDPRTERTPIMLLASAKDQGLINRALAGGADDVMVQPCHPTELLWRVRGLIRRYEAPPPKPQRRRLGPFDLDLEQGVARVNGKSLDLTKKELCLLELFLRNPERVLSRRFLLENIWGYDHSVRPRVVDLCVFQLRKKLGLWGRCLQTRRNFGYHLQLAD